MLPCQSGRIASNLRCLCKSLDCRAILSKCNDFLVLWKRRKSTMFILLQTLESRLSLQQFVKILSDWHNRPQLRYNLARLQHNCKFYTIDTPLVMVVSLICGVAAEVYGLFVHVREEDMRAIHSLPIFAKADSLHHNCLNVFAIQAILVKIA